LQVDKQFDGYITRWFNDQDDRIQRALGAGYEFVPRDDVKQVGDKDVANGNTDMNSMVSRVVGRTAENQPIRAFLMKIRKEWYQEDKAKKEETNRLVDEAIRAGTAGGASIQNQYGEVKLQA
jgi:galactokinase/mevalonate kinase-like predicted kinase